MQRERERERYDIIYVMKVSSRFEFFLLIFAYGAGLALWSLGFGAERDSVWKNTIAIGKHRFEEVTLSEQNDVYVMLMILIIEFCLH